MTVISSDLIMVLVVLGLATLLAVPGLMAYRRALKEDESILLRIQIDKLSDEIMRLQVKVDEQQRKINEMSVQIAGLKSKSDAIGRAAKRLAEQLRVQNIEPIVDADKLIEMLEKE